MINVFVVDDHPIVRAGIVGMLETDPDLTVVGQAGNGQEALQLLAALPVGIQVDVILTDLRMPIMDGVTLTEAIHRLGANNHSEDADTCPPTEGSFSLPEGMQAPRVVVLTTYDTDRDILRAVEVGALGYLLKDAPLEQITQAVKAATAGESTLSPKVAARLVAHMQNGTPPEPTVPQAKLSPREIEVLKLVATGYTNRQVGRELGVSTATVKTYLERIFDKLDVPDRTSAVTRAFTLGQISFDSQ